jgi:hypothetical protein
VITSDRTRPHADDLGEFLVDASLEVLMDRHRRRIEEPGQRPVPVRPDDLERMILRREQQAVDRQVERGVYVPMTAKEVRRLTGRDWRSPLE